MDFSAKFVKGTQKEILPMCLCGNADSVLLSLPAKSMALSCHVVMKILFLSHIASEFHL